MHFKTIGVDLSKHWKKSIYLHTRSVIHSPHCCLLPSVFQFTEEIRVFRVESICVFPLLLIVLRRGWHPLSVSYCDRRFDYSLSSCYISHIRYNFVGHHHSLDSPLPVRVLQNGWRLTRYLVVVGSLGWWRGLSYLGDFLLISCRGHRDLCVTTPVSESEVTNKFQTVLNAFKFSFVISREWGELTISSCL